MIEPASDQNREHTDDSLREVQEAEVMTSHRLVCAEFALAREAALVSNVFSQAGLPFDLHTFVAVRILESCIAEQLDLVSSLQSSTLRRLIDRSAELTASILAAST
jgi:hypothetical protein